MLRFCCCSLVLLGSILPTSAQSSQSDVEKNAWALAGQLVKLHRAWTTISTKGASIEVKELLRKEAPGAGAVVQYHFYVKGLPEGHLFDYVNWPINQREPQTSLQGISIGKDGILMCAARSPEQCGDLTKKDDPIEFTYIAQKGEPFRIAIVDSENPDTRLTTVLVPDPIETRTKGCSLNVIQLLPKFVLAYLQGSGFPSNTDISFESWSYKENHILSGKTDDSGALQIAMMPNVAGHDSGTTHVRAMAPDCSPSIEFEWGR